MLRGTTLERYQAHDLGIRIGIETLNEARDLEHRPRFDDPRADEPTPLQASPRPPTPAATDGNDQGAPLALIQGGNQP